MRVIFLISKCVRCGNLVSEVASKIVEKSGGKYPLLCEDCLLEEMDQSLLEYNTCSECGRPIDSIRRWVIHWQRFKGSQVSMLCSRCLKKELEVSKSALSHGKKTEQND